jgi:antitoxin FitA
MVALQIRDVPNDVRDTLAERARARGQSMQAFLLALVEDEASRSKNLALLERFSGRTDGSRLTPAEVLETIDRARGDRDDGLMGTASTAVAG